MALSLAALVIRPLAGFGASVTSINSDVVLGADGVWTAGGNHSSDAILQVNGNSSMIFSGKCVNSRFSTPAAQGVPLR